LKRVGCSKIVRGFLKGFDNQNPAPLKGSSV